eukprot:TRINITY_DN1761_c0_g1_i3.p1 TRINITY_DN1761_c0_g1~~TRINITY_DN1761_c0_g1_i3.p1  ORF type:complete len:1071 (-),score=311.08 TRINITY_DN1761_c0_g1_i3:77-2953(-)
MYDPHLRELTELYAHESLMTCVCASVNRDKHLIAFTTMTKIKNQGDGASNRDFDEIFESCLVEVRPQARCYSLNIRSRESQRIQFLYDNSSRTNNFLFFLDKEFIHLYLISIQRRANGNGIKITAQPHLQSIIVKLYMWMYWDTHRSLLYYIPAPRVNKEKQSTNSDHVIRCVNFKDMKHEMMFELPIQIRLTKSRDTHPHWLHGGRIPSYLHLVRLRGNAVVLCQQQIQIKAKQPPQIIVSVWVLHRRSKIEFSLQMNNFDAQVIRRTNVFFGSLGDMLMVYIPGYYIRFIDCGTEHDTCESLELHGCHWATPLPSQISAAVAMKKTKEESLEMEQEKSVESSNVEKQGEEKFLAEDDPSLFQPAVIIPFDPELLATMESFETTEPDYRGHCFLDCRTGDLFEFTIDRASILELFQESNPSWHIQALHMAMVHMGDTELVDQIMMTLCTSYPQNATSDLFKEFLLGTTYQELRALGMENHLLQVVPITTQTTFGTESSGESRRRLGNMMITSLSSNQPLPNGLDGVIRTRFPFDKYTSTQVTSADVIATNSASASLSKPTQSIRKFFTKLFVAEEEADTSASDDTEETPGPLNRGTFVEILTEFVMSQFVKEGRPQCLRLAQEYSSSQSLEANRLFDCILAGTGLIDSSGIGSGGGSTGVGASVTRTNAGTTSSSSSSSSGGGFSFFSQTSTTTTSSSSSSGSSNWFGFLSSEEEVSVDEEIKEVDGGSEDKNPYPSGESMLTFEDPFAPAGEAEFTCFQLLELMFVALEELSFPFPKDFQNRFCALSLRVLTRPMMLQYIDRGVLRLTPEFVQAVSAVLGPDDAMFKFKLADRLADQDEAREILKTHDENIKCLLEYFLSSAPIFSPKTGNRFWLPPFSPNQEHDPSSLVGLDVGTGAEATEFVPLTIFLNSLNLQCSENEFEFYTMDDLSYINQHSAIQFRGMVEEVTKEVVEEE